MIGYFIACVGGGVIGLGANIDDKVGRRAALVLGLIIWGLGMALVIR